MDSPDHLYIIGNGFDLHHKINSSYRDFKKWMEREHSPELAVFEEAYGYCDDDWWSDFENNLASMDIISYAQQVAFENEPDLLSDHCDRTWNDAQIEVEEQLKGLFSMIRDCFHDWIEQLNAPRKDRCIEVVVRNSAFLNFNYTKTLENLYRIKSSNICHIHGCIYENEEFILGHGKTMEDLIAMNNTDDRKPPVDPEAYEEWRNEMEMAHPFHEQLAEDAAFQGVESQKKPVDKLIKKYSSFFDTLHSVSDVHVYGISFSEVDAPYLNLIAQIAANARWEISDYEDNNKDSILNFINKNHIIEYRIIELTDLIDKQQLKIEFS